MPAEVLELDEWKLYDGDHPLARMFYDVLQVEEDFKDWLKIFNEKVRSEIVAYPLLEDLFDEEDNKKFGDGFLTESKVDIAGAARVFGCQIELVECNALMEICEKFTFEPNGTAKLHLRLFSQPEENIIGSLL